MNKQQLASKIWESANKMRSKIEANEYKDYILGFIFYKFLSDKEEEYVTKKLGMTCDDVIHYLNEEDQITVKDCRTNLGYFISYENLFSTWLKKGNDFDVSNVTDALSAFNRLIDNNYNRVFSKIFDTLDKGLSKLGESSGARTKAISGLLYLIKDIPMDGKQDYDVLGFIYEYLISQFAANAGKKAGEFYTPHEVSTLMSEIVANHLKDREKIEIYDPTSGSGSLLINIGKSVAKHVANQGNIKYYAQELKEATYNLTRMNLVMRGISPANILTRNGDTLEEDWPYFDEADKTNTYHPLYVDAVVSNPPYSQPWEPNGKDNEARYKEYGIAPKSKADYAFLLHDLYHVKPDGIMTIVLPHGVLFRGGCEEEIRKNLIERNNIDAIIGLPANIFFGTGIPTIIMVLKQKRQNTDVLIVDASKGFAKVGKNNVLRASDIKRIVDTVISRTTTPKFSKLVAREEIRNNDYNLNIPRYVDSSEKAESFDIYASMNGGIPNKEIDELDEYWNAFPTLKNELFTIVNSKFSKCISSDKNSEIIKNNDDVKLFIDKFNIAFDSFNQYLNETLIMNVENVNSVQIEPIITNEIFKRLNNIPLVDKYHAYQILNDRWNLISSDIEIIQTEGIASIKRVNPNMIMKKSNGKDSEVQDGWGGHIIPFDLVQKELLADDLNEIKTKEEELNSILSTYDEILESISEEDRGEFLNDDNSAFDFKNVKTIIKQYRKSEKYSEDSVEYKLLKVSNLNDKEKELKKIIKDLSAKQILKTKQKIESLTDNEALHMLDLKWNSPVLSDIKELPLKMVKELTNKVNTLSKKYEDTLLDIDSQIKSSSNELCSLIDDLIGDEFDMKGLSELKNLLKGE